MTPVSKIEQPVGPAEAPVDGERLGELLEFIGGEFVGVIAHAAIVIEGCGGPRLVRESP